MGKTVNPREKIVQRSVGFRLRQILFLVEHPEFKPDKHSRKAIDEQIAILDPKYLGEEE